MGIDYGAKRVGIALSDEKGEFALPYKVLANNKDLLDAVKALCEEKKVERIVIGKSENFEGKDNAIMAKINSFIETLKNKVTIPISLEQEFMTSQEARRIQGKNDMNDASAAALILKSYLEKLKHQDTITKNKV